MVYQPPRLCPLPREWKLDGIGWRGNRSGFIRRHLRRLPRTGTAKSSGSQFEFHPKPHNKLKNQKLVMKTTNAHRILRTAAFQYADARMQALRQWNSDWIRGFEDGRANSAGSILRLFLRDQPRRVQLEIGTEIRTEIAEIKLRRISPVS